MNRALTALLVVFVLAASHDGQYLGAQSHPDVERYHLTTGGAGSACS